MISIVVYCCKGTWMEWNAETTTKNTETSQYLAGLFMESENYNNNWSNLAENI